MQLRPMLMSDADFLLDMKNYPETRRYSFVSKEEIKYDDHINFLKENIHQFKVIVIETFCYGIVRVQNKEISIWIDRKFWGKGIATSIFEQCEKGTLAKVVNGNIGSIKALVRAGFELIEHKDNYYILQK